MQTHAAEFIRTLLHPFKFRMFLFWRLPAAFFSGVRIRAVDENECKTSVPFKWLTQNPFRSTYFASMAMAAEMSTGALALVHLHKRNPAVSMLVVKVEAKYFKKATRRTVFTCSDGQQIKATIEAAIAAAEGRSIAARSVGTNPEGETIAEFFITWSFKAKKK